MQPRDNYEIVVIGLMGQTFAARGLKLSENGVVEEPASVEAWLGLSSFARVIAIRSLTV